ncbi:flagellar biosynthetic protein FliO [Brevibacillus daliensis]|uniref:flagellar biosynthetic protein FliO n=1 Tax=Brevibacillus daliensis TaxID=2892995 RepID=UPI001E4D0569|nr:flagellar biosynthetic protein FliO [Brevibacillus daliensis]
MKWFTRCTVLVTCILSCLFLVQREQVVFANAQTSPGSAYDWLQPEGTGTQTDPAGEKNEAPLPESPSIASFLIQTFFSLAVVVALIVLLLKWLGKKQTGGFRENGPFRSLGGFPLGNGKSLQLVMIGDHLYIIGVGDSVQMIRHIPPGDELDVIPGDELDVILVDMESRKPSTEWSWSKLNSLLPSKNKFQAEEQDQQDASFGEMLEQQWREVSDQKSTQEPWNQNRHKGD